jgi:dienelactone hydrolase
MRVLNETATENYIRKKITYAADPEDRVPAYLLIPKRVKNRMPAMLCLPDATSSGKDEPAGLGGRDSLRYAHELAERGYVCLVPDYPSVGEYAYDFKSKGRAYSSGAMKAVWNHIRGLDVLESVPGVDLNRMGCIGHGLGGQSALLTAAFDYRAAVVVASGGFTSFPRYKGGDLADWADERVMPRLRTVYNLDPAKIPFDFAELIATLAPRPVFVNAPLGDAVRDAEGVKSALTDASAVYKLRRAERALRAVHPDAGHDFPNEARTEAYTWLDQLLRP